MFKRIFIIVTALILLKPAYDLGLEIYDEIKFQLNGPSDEVVDVLEEDVPKPTVQTNSNATNINQNTNRLPKSVKSIEELTEAFYYYFSNWETEFEINYVGNMSNIDQIIKKASNDAAKRNDYINGHLSERHIKYEYTNKKAEIHVSQQYLTNKSQEQFVDEMVESILASEKSKRLSDFEKVKFVNDYIVKNTVYGSNTVSASPHSAYAVLKEGIAVCQGYALLAQKMLTELGIESKYVVGEVSSGGHAWNLVKLNGEWYHLDTTWNDPIPDRPYTVSYKYFLVNDAILMEDHVWQQKDYPSASSDQYAYMQHIDQAFQLNNYFYFSNLEDDNRLYRVNIQTEVQELVSQNRAQYIVGEGDWLYYSNYSKGAYLTKMKTDGTGEEILFREEVKNLFIENGYLFFTTPSGMKKIKI